MTLVLGLAGATLPATAEHAPPPEPAALDAELRDAELHGAELDDLDGTEQDDLVADPTDAPDEEGEDGEEPPETPSESPREERPDVPPAVEGDGEAVDPAHTGTKREAQSASPEDAEAISPAAAGPDGAQPPYVHWTVADAAGSPVGGATFEIAGPATWGTFSGINWGSATSVPDCVSSPCAGPDLDPDPGEFLVKTSGTDAVRADRRYRVRATSAPSGHVLTADSDWHELPGTRATPDRNAWRSDTYDFGTFPVRQIGSHAPVCAAGAIYGLSDDGRIREVSATGSVTDFGQQAPGVSSFNGLGIGYGGESVYAYERSSRGNETSVSRATIWSFDTGSGTWSSTGVTVNSNTSGGTVQFVAGAVDLDTGKFYIGGFSANGRLFRIWEYDPTTTSISYTGHIDTSSGAGGANNGDMAFNAAGDLFVVRGSGTTTTVFSVTAANLQAATGGSISSSRAASVSTMSDVNGVAFDADGKAYLGSGSQLRSYDMPGWSGATAVVSNGLDSTDLASCSSPPTITLEKYVEGERVRATDQFTLSLDQGSQNLGTQTTEGNESGLQDVRVGPLPTVRNVELSFSETAAGTTDPADYVSSYTCRVDGDPLVSGTGTAGTVTIPAGGQDVVCTFRNAPLIADVTLYKFMTDRDGENPEPYPDWTVGMVAEPTAGSVTDVSPSGDTQRTGDDGAASWSIRFDDHDSRATVTVSELMQDGFEPAEDAVCVVGGEEVSFTGTSHRLEGIAPGDEVRCAFTNKPSPASLTLTKEVVNDHGGTLTAADWDGALFARAGEGPQLVFDSGETREVLPGSYTLTEDVAPGYEQVGLTCEGGSLDPDTGSVTVVDGASVECTFTNRDLPGSVTWSKVVEGTADVRLAGSQWELTHPDGTTSVIVDCIAAGAEDCHDLDRDPAAGGFRLVDLAWGEYTLVETKAPPGYVLDATPRTFTITAGELDLAVGAIANVQHDGPALPLTGGLGRDHVYLAGGLVLLLSLTIVGATGLHRRRHPRSAP